MYIRLLLMLILFSGHNYLNAQNQTDHLEPELFHTKNKFVLINGGIGGGNYPFNSLGISLNYQFIRSKTMVGAGAQYIGNTSDGMFGEKDPVQTFPLMVDVRQTFMESENGRFATYIFAATGYVISITSNGESEEGEYEYFNGWGFNPGIGFRYNVFKNTGLMLDLTWFHHSHPRKWLEPVIKEDKKHWNLMLIRANVFF